MPLGTKWTLPKKTTSSPSRYTHRHRQKRLSRNGSATIPRRRYARSLKTLLIRGDSSNSDEFPTENTENIRSDTSAIDSRVFVSPVVAEGYTEGREIRDRVRRRLLRRAPDDVDNVQRRRNRQRRRRLSNIVPARRVPAGVRDATRNPFRTDCFARNRTEKWLRGGRTTCIQVYNTWRLGRPCTYVGQSISVIL